MREIKFRAWDVGKQEMFEIVRFDFRSTTHPLGLGYLVNPSLGVRFKTHEQAILMQYTGLKDKNGVEIFIGDILLLDLLSGDRHSEVIICEDREIPVVQYFAYHGWEPLHAYVGKPDTCLQVIGNIHQDAHLLESR